MSHPTEEIIEMCITLAQERHLKATVKRSFKILTVTCIGVLVAALIGWPRGLVFGATAAAISAGIVGGGFKPVYEIIRDDMTEEQKSELAGAVCKALNRISFDDVTEDGPQGLLHEVVVNEMQNFFSKKLDLSIS